MPPSPPPRAAILLKPADHQEMILFKLKTVWSEGARVRMTPLDSPLVPEIRM